MSGSSTPAGWYPDPQQPGQQRYWDGSAWTEATQPGGPAAPPPPPMGGYAAPQQMGYGYAVAGPAPNNYMVFAILTTLFCCLPAGVVSIVKAAQVNSKWNAGDQMGAQDASRQAKQWAIISAVVGLVLIVLLVTTGEFNAEFDSGT
jgi:hypothetical protein